MFKGTNRFIWVGGIVLCVAVGCLFLSVQGRGNIWQAYSQQKLQEAINQHKPVIIDFSAQWCYGCRQLDRIVFSNPKIKAEFSQGIALRLDATNIDAPVIAAIIDQYNVIGLPTVVFLDRAGHEIKEARVEGAGSVKEFEKSLQMWKDKR